MLVLRTSLVGQLFRVWLLTEILAGVHDDSIKPSTPEMTRHYAWNSSSRWDATRISGMIYRVKISPFHLELYSAKELLYVAILHVIDILRDRFKLGCRD
jgi:hypothetical protein